MRYRTLIFDTELNVRRMLPRLTQLGLLLYVMLCLVVFSFGKERNFASFATILLNV